MSSFDADFDEDLSYEEPTPPVLTTERLCLRLPEPSDVPAIVRYHRENQAHLAPTSPPSPVGFYTEEFWQARMYAYQAAWQNETAVGFFLFPHEDPTRVVGGVRLSMIQQAPAHFCNLGYQLAAEFEGQGYMSEALKAVVAYAFDDLNLHRLHAAYMPHNLRSGKVLRRLGFQVDGFARDYLFIAGAWQDHVLTSLTNPAWRPL